MYAWSFIGTPLNHRRPTTKKPGEPAGTGVTGSVFWPGRKRTCNRPASESKTPSLPSNKFNEFIRPWGSGATWRLEVGGTNTLPLIFRPFAYDLIWNNALFTMLFRFCIGPIWSWPKRKVSYRPASDSKYPPPNSTNTGSRTACWIPILICCYENIRAFWITRSALTNDAWPVNPERPRWPFCKRFIACRNWIYWIIPRGRINKTSVG